MCNTDSRVFTLIHALSRETFLRMVFGDIFHALSRSFTLGSGIIIPGLGWFSDNFVTPCNIYHHRHTVPLFSWCRVFRVMSIYISYTHNSYKASLMSLYITIVITPKGCLALGSLNEGSVNLELSNGSWAEYIYIFFMYMALSAIYIYT